VRNVRVAVAGAEAVYVLRMRAFISRRRGELWWYGNNGMEWGWDRKELPR